MKKIKLICAFPFYIIAVIIASIIAIPISIMHMFEAKAYFNPIKLGWYYFNGSKYKMFSTFEDSELLLISPFFVLFLFLIGLVITLIWKQVFLFILVIGVSYCIYRMGKFVVKNIFNK